MDRRTMENWLHGNTRTILSLAIVQLEKMPGERSTKTMAAETWNEMACLYKEK